MKRAFSIFVAVSTGLLAIGLICSAGPIHNTQKATLIEKWPLPKGATGEYTQRLVDVDRTSDAHAIVCLKVHVANEKDRAITCFYAMNEGNEVLVVQELIAGEERT